MKYPKELRLTITTKSNKKTVGQFKNFLAKNKKVHLSRAERYRSGGGIDYRVAEVESCKNYYGGGDQRIIIELQRSDLNR